MFADQNWFLLIWFHNGTLLIIKYQIFEFELCVKYSFKYRLVLEEPSSGRIEPWFNLLQPSGHLI
jgi:hypothetical protein